MHEFLLRKTSDGTVRLFMRKSSQASSWLPQGEGYPVFKSTPEGHPQLATPHPEHSWGRADVENAVRAVSAFAAARAASAFFLQHAP